MGVCYHAHARFLDRRGNRITVPAPVDPLTPHVPWWYDYIAAKAAELRRTGFTAILFPPPEKTQSGAAPTGDGYGAYDQYDIGSKSQSFSVPTRFGSREQLQRAVAIAHACGLDAYSDFVMHQVIGGDNGVYRYLGADGRHRNGRFPKDPGCFRGSPPRRPEDPVPVPADDFSFGDEFVFKDCNPPRYTITEMIAWSDWLIRTLDLQGGRVDDTKGTWADFVSEWMNSGAMAGKFFASEYFDGNPANLYSWAHSPPMNGRSAVFDFTLHWALQGVCNNNADMHSLDGAGYTARDPFRSATFVDNPDTDLSPGQSIIRNKLLAYAFILTTEGYPFIFHKDYAQERGCYGLKPWIDTLVWIHEHLATGPTVTRYVDSRVLVYERTGFPNLLTAISNDPFTSHTVTCQTGFGAHVRLHDYTGRHPDLSTDAQGGVTFAVPSNAFDGGHSYLCFSRAGIDRVNALERRPTHQTFFGATDLDIGPVTNHGNRQVGRIWCAAGTEVTALLKPSTNGWSHTPQSAVRLTITGPDGAQLVARQYTQGSPGEPATARVAHDGWHVLDLAGSNLPAEGSAYELSVTYTATQELPHEH